MSGKSAIICLCHLHMSCKTRDMLEVHTLIVTGLLHSSCVVHVCLCGDVPQPEVVLCQSGALPCDDSHTGLHMHSLRLTSQWPAFC